MVNQLAISTFTKFVLKTQQCYYYLKADLNASLKGPTTLRITTFNIMTLSMKGFYVTLSISDTEHNNTLAVILSIAFYSLSC
jgi:hypothetical protein